MRVLLDTCVLSELRRPQPHPGVQDAVDAIEGDSLFVSVVSVGEIAKGIALLKEGKRKRDLGRWLQSLEVNYADRILGIDLEISHIWGELTATAQGKIVPVTDGLIAATARRHGLHVMTRNIDHFEPAGVLIVNPWMDKNQ